MNRPSYSSIPNRHADLVQRPRPDSHAGPEPKSEEELDSLIAILQERHGDANGEQDEIKPDPIEFLRQLMLNELIPVFVQLVEKYSKTGISMQMDASNFLEGGREIRFEFGVGPCRTQLLGTVTSEAIAFHETRFNPDVHGELVSGPMLRLRNLDAQTFRGFVCERLAILLRDATRRR